MKGVQISARDCDVSVRGADGEDSARVAAGKAEGRDA